MKDPTVKCHARAIIFCTECLLRVEDSKVIENIDKFIVDASQGVQSILDKGLNKHNADLRNTSKEAKDKWDYIDLIRRRIRHKINELKYKLKGDKDRNDIKKRLDSWNSLATFYDDTFRENVKESHQIKILGINEGVRILYKELIQSKISNGQLNFEAFIDRIEGRKNSSDGGELATNAQMQRSENETYLDGLSETHWIFYYYDYTVNNRYTSVAKLLISFGNLTEISKSPECVFLKETKTDHDWKGTLKNDGNNSGAYFIIDMVRSNPPKKNLQLRILINNSIGPDNILFGQYIDFEHPLHHVSGSFILEKALSHLSSEWYKGNESKRKKYPQKEKDRIVKISGQDLVLTTRELHHQSGWSAFIPVEIAQYFEDKWKNYTKTLSSWDTLEKLKEFHYKQKKKRTTDSPNNSIIDYDIFLVTPVKYLQNFDEFFCDVERNLFDRPFSELPDGADRLTPKRTLQEIGIKRIYSPTRVEYSATNDLETTGDDIVDHEFDKMRRSSTVLFVFPDDVVTSALIKIGWAMVLGKRILVFAGNFELLPEILRTNINMRFESKTEVGKKLSELESFLIRAYRIQQPSNDAPLGSS